MKRGFTMNNKIFKAALIVAIVQIIFSGFIIAFYGWDTYLVIHFDCMKVLTLCLFVALIPLWFKREQITQYLKSLK